MQLGIRLCLCRFHAICKNVRVAWPSQSNRVSPRKRQSFLLKRFFRSSRLSAQWSGSASLVPWWALVSGQKLGWLWCNCTQPLRCLSQWLDLVFIALILIRTVFHGSAPAVLSHWFRCAPGLMYRCLEGAENDEDYPDGPKGRSQENGWILHSFTCHAIFITSLHYISKVP